MSSVWRCVVHAKRSTARSASLTLRHSQGMPVMPPMVQPYPVPGHPGYYYMPSAPLPPPEGPLAVHSAQPGVMWDPHASTCINNPQPHMQASRPLEATVSAWLHIAAVWMFSTPCLAIRTTVVTVRKSAMSNRG